MQRSELKHLEQIKRLHSVEMNYQQLFATVFLLIISYSLTETWKQLVKKIQLKRNGVKAIATIVDFDKKEDTDSTQYFPVLRFATSLGSEIEARVGEARTIEPKVGKEVVVFYNALNPREVTIENKWFLYLHVFSILAELYLVIGFAYFLLYNKWLF